MPDDHVLRMMEETMDRVTEFLGRKDLVWQCLAATEVHERYPDAVQYEAKHADLSLKVVAGSAKNGDRFVMGLVAMTGRDGSPIIMNLPPDLADEASKIALKSILNRN